MKPKRRISKPVVLLVILVLVGTFAIAGEPSNKKRIELSKKDYLAMIVCNYVYGFNYYDTSVNTTDNLVSIGIYYNSSFYAESLPYEIAEKFRSEVPKILKEHSWANDVVVVVKVYSEPRIHRNYIIPLTE